MLPYRKRVPDVKLSIFLSQNTKNFVSFWQLVKLKLYNLITEKNVFRDHDCEERSSYFWLASSSVSLNGISIDVAILDAWAECVK